MKLTQDNIQFIDNYLQAADVKHIDIRVEMIDHVATAIETEMKNGDERDFYYIFKDYMIANKKRLLKDNKKLIRTTDIYLSKQIILKLFSWQSISVFILSLLTFNHLSEIYVFESFKEWMGYLPFFSFLTLSVVFLVLFKIKKYERISSIERLAFVLVMLFNITHLATNMAYSNFFDDKPQLLFYATSIALSFLTSVAVVFFKLIKESKDKIKVLFAQ